MPISCENYWQVGTAYESYINEAIMCFIFGKKKELEQNMDAGREKYIAALKSWHQTRDVEQSNLEQSFQHEQIDDYPVNIWDEINESNSTYCYVEDSDIPDKVKLQVLLHIQNFINQNSLLTDLKCQIDLIFEDHSILYPELVDGEHKSIGTKMWKLKISNIDYESLDLLIDRIKKVSDFSGKPVRVYSES